MIAWPNVGKCTLWQKCIKILVLYKCRSWNGLTFPRVGGDDEIVAGKRAENDSSLCYNSEKHKCRVGILFNEMFGKWQTISMPWQKSLNQPRLVPVIHVCCRQMSPDLIALDCLALCLFPPPLPPPSPMSWSWLQRTWRKWSLCGHETTSVSAVPLGLSRQCWWGTMFWDLAQMKVDWETPLSPACSKARHCRARFWPFTTWTPLSVSRECSRKEFSPCFRLWRTQWIAKFSPFCFPSTLVKVI